jgi:phospholipid/cholesterol/gamma-HCH transport system permease protein
MYKKSSTKLLLKNQIASLKVSADKTSILLSGDWLWSSINEKILFDNLNNLNKNEQINIDGTSITSVDTTGIYFIVRLVNTLKQKQIQVLALNLNAKEQKLFTRIQANLANPNMQNIKLNQDVFTSLGRATFNTWDNIIDGLGFFGVFCTNLLKFFKSPLNIAWSEVARMIINCGIRGLWVACLLSFLIGVTLAYQMAPQFTTYGANVYIVNFLGIALLKEVSPLLTAIIVAGRTGAAITAEIGTQKVQEEIDALQTMGISAIQRIVLPKVIGVLIVVPLITALADIVSMLGGAIVANASLGVNYTLFLDRAQNYVSVNNYTSGIIKSVAFALIVALVGCFHGLKVKSNANSIGEETTNSVVTSIILIVLFDAIFAIIFKILGV